MKIYVVTAGEYSDYHIVGVFTDEALANSFAEFHDGEYGTERRVETYEADLDADQIRQGLARYYVTMRYHGEGDATLSPDADAPLAFTDGYLRGWVYAQDKQHALKIANEKRAQLIASEEWPYEESPEEKKARQDKEEQSRLDALKGQLERLVLSLPEMSDRELEVCYALAVEGQKGRGDGRTEGFMRRAMTLQIVREANRRKPGWAAEVEGTAK